LDADTITLDVIITAWLSKRNNIHNTKIRLIILGDRYICCNVANSWRIAIIITIERRVAQGYSFIFAADNILATTRRREAGNDPPFSLLLLVGGETPTMAQTGGGDRCRRGGANWRQQS
jgi:hypothetical protein